MHDIDSSIELETLDSKKKKTNKLKEGRGKI